MTYNPNNFPTRLKLPAEKKHISTPPKIAPDNNKKFKSNNHPLSFRDKRLLYLYLCIFFTVFPEEG